jgi:hypothetical protein
MSRSSREFTTLSVQANVPSARVRLLNDTGRVVKSGTGSIEWKGSPGIYEVQVEAGSAFKKELVAVGPDRPSHHEVSLVLDTVTPVRDSIAHHEFHAGPASDLSVSPTKSLGDRSRLVLFARVIDPELSDDAPAVSYTAIELLDADGEVLAKLDDDGVAGPGFRAISVDLDPGVYRLRSRPRSRVSSEGSSTVEQTIVTCEGWTTLGFVPIWPDDGEAAVEAMAVHMVEMGLPFDTDSDGAETVTAAELALQGLRAGEVLLPDDMLERLLYAKFANPMLGIYGGHALLMKRVPRWTLAETVVRNLRKIIPDHPDVVALHLLVKELRDADSDSRVPNQALPPMLRLSYEAIIRRDAREPGLIVAASVAELASARLRPDGAWARWTSLEGFQAAEESPELFDAAATSVEELFDTTDIWVDEDPEFEDVYAADGPTIEVAQMAEYVNEVAEQRRRTGSTVKIDVSQLSRQVGLPTSAVKRGLRGIGKASSRKFS